MLHGCRSTARGVPLFLGLLLALLPRVSTRAGETVHYTPGLMNIRDYIVPETGIYFVDYNYYYTTERLNNPNGNKVKSVTIPDPGGRPPVTLNVSVNVDMYANAPAVIWTLPWKPYGMKLSGYIAPTIANSSLSGSLRAETGQGVNPSTSSFGFGDLFVQPVWLGYTLPHWDFAFGYGFYAPTGKYDTDNVTLPGIGTVKTTSADNIGLGFWEQQLQSTVVWYPMTNQATAVMATLTYETCGKEEDFNITPGDALSLNWGISQYLPLVKDETLLLEVGPAGYDTWQISNDTGSAARNPSVHDQVHAVGGQIGLTYVPWMAVLNFHYFYEFSSEDRFQGQSFSLSITKKF
jgi:hypothetical protein